MDTVHRANSCSKDMEWIYDLKSQTRVLRQEFLPLRPRICRQRYKTCWICSLEKRDLLLLEMVDLFSVGNDSGISIAVLKFGANMFHFSKSNFTLDLLAKKPIGIPMKLVFCFNRAFVPFVSSSHELSNLRCDVWIWS